MENMKPDDSVHVKPKSDAGDETKIGQVEEKIEKEKEIIQNIEVDPSECDCEQSKVEERTLLGSRRIYRIYSMFSGGGDDDAVAEEQCTTLQNRENRNGSDMNLSALSTQATVGSGSEGEQKHKGFSPPDQFVYRKAENAKTLLGSRRVYRWVNGEFEQQHEIENSKSKSDSEEAKYAASPFSEADNTDISEKEQHRFLGSE